MSFIGSSNSEPPGPVDIGLPPSGTHHTRYMPTHIPDDEEIMHHIGFLDNFAHKSVEELRFEDFLNTKAMHDSDGVARYVHSLVCMWNHE